MEHLFRKDEVLAFRGNAFCKENDIEGIRLKVGLQGESGGSSQL